jgi:hypothetical protein
MACTSALVPVSTPLSNKWTAHYPGRGIDRGTSQNSALRRARPAVTVQTIGPCQKHKIQGFLEGIAVPFLPESFYFVESPHPRTLREARTIIRRRPLPFAWPGWTGTVGTARRRPSRPRRPSREGLRTKVHKVLRVLCLGFSG